MVKDGGIVTALDAKTGKELYTQRAIASGSYYASPVAAGGHIYFVSLPDGAVTVLKAGAKAAEVVAGVERTYGFARKYKIKTAWGTDILFSRAFAQRQGALLAVIGKCYAPAEALIMATSTNAELLNLSGKRNPYPGKLGVIEEGALADLLLVDGNPLENINLVADPEKNLLVIMKDGAIYKNALPR